MYPFTFDARCALSRFIACLLKRVGLLCALFIACVSAHAQAPRLYAYNGANKHLVSFSADSPATFLSDVALIGLVGQEHVVGMDFMPRSDELHGLVRDHSASTSRLVKIDRDSGTLTNLPTAITLTGGPGYYGVSYSGVSSYMFITNGTSNVAVAPYSGFGAVTNTAYAYAIGDPGFGTMAEVFNIAHTPSTGITQLDTLYGISLAAGLRPVSLVRIGGLNGAAPQQASGQMFTVGSLGLGRSIGGYGGFDIQAGTNVGYAALERLTSVSTPSIFELYTINLTSGAATLMGTIGTPGVGTRIDGIAIAPPSQCLDIDGDGVLLPATDGLILTRIMLGMTGAAVLNGAQPTPPAARGTWPTIRDHLNTKCGMNLAP